MLKLPFHVFFRHGFSLSTCDWLWSSLLSLTGSGQVWLPLSLLLSSDVLQLPCDGHGCRCPASAGCC